MWVVKFVIVCVIVMEILWLSGYIVVMGELYEGMFFCFFVFCCVFMEVVMGFFDFIKEVGEKLFYGSVVVVLVDVLVDVDVVKVVDDVKG